MATAAIVGGTLLAAYMSSQAQKEGASEAAGAQLAASNASIAEQRRQFDLVWNAYDPYRQAGYNALGQLTGIDYAGTQGNLPQGGNQTVPDDQMMAYLASGAPSTTAQPQPVNALAGQAQPQPEQQWGWYRPGGPQGTTAPGIWGGQAEQLYSLIPEGSGVGAENFPGSVYAPIMEGSPVSGFGNFSLSDLQNAQNLARSGVVPGGTTGNIMPVSGTPQGPGAAPQAPAAPATYASYPGVPAGGIDPTGGSEQYVNALAALDPTLAGRVNKALGVSPEADPLNALYQWQQQQGEQAINRAMAARGKYNSGAATQELSDFNRALVAEEAQRIYGRATDEYNRQYGQQTDLFNLTNALARLRYGKVMDILNLGTGAQGAMSNAALSTGQGISSAYLQQGNALANSALQSGQAQAGFYSGLGGLPQNTLATQYYWNQLQPQQAAYTAPTGGYYGPSGGADTSWGNFY